MGKLKGRGEREFSGKDPVGSLYVRSHTQDSNSLSGNYFTKVLFFKKFASHYCAQVIICQCSRCILAKTSECCNLMVLKPVHLVLLDT